MHLREVALREGQLVLLRAALALEHAHALTMLRREPLGYHYRFLILDLRREAATPLGIGQALPLNGKVGIGARQSLTHLLHRDPRFHHSLTHLARQVPQVARGRRGVQCGPQGVPQPLEHDRAPPSRQLFRTVFAKNDENTGCTAFDLQLGQVGCRRPCWLIGCCSLKRFRHLVQRYS